MSEIDLDVIRERSRWALSHIHEVNSHYASAADVPALLARIAELDADLSDAHHEGFGVGMESADRDIDQIAAAAERRGYERAVARLRDDNRYLSWLRSLGAGVLDLEPLPPKERLARYLDAVKESTDGR